MRCWKHCATVNEITTALASLDDVRAIARRRGFDDTAFRLALELAERGTVWAARDQSEVVGIAIAHASEAERYVGELFVEPSYRGQGIGAELLRATFLDADDAARRALLDPNDAASMALGFRNGLAPTGDGSRTWASERWTGSSFGIGHRRDGATADAVRLRYDLLVPSTIWIN